MRERFVASQLADLRALGLDWDGEVGPPVGADGALRRGARAARARRSRLPLLLLAPRGPRGRLRPARRGARGPLPGHLPRARRGRVRPPRRGRRALRAAAARRAHRGDDRRPPARRARRPGRRHRPAPPRRRLRLQPRRRRRRCRPGRSERSSAATTCCPRPPARRCSATCSACPRPTWAHVPLVLGPDGARLAKRHGAVTLAELAARGQARRRPRLDGPVARFRRARGAGRRRRPRRPLRPGGAACPADRVHRFGLECAKLSIAGISSVPIVAPSASQTLREGPSSIQAGIASRSHLRSAPPRTWGGSEEILAEESEHAEATTAQVLGIEASLPSPYPERTVFSSGLGVRGAVVRGNETRSSGS